MVGCLLSVAFTSSGTAVEAAGGARPALRRCADLRTPSSRPSHLKGGIDASEASLFQACWARPSVLGQKGPSTRKRGE